MTPAPGYEGYKELVIFEKMHGNNQDQKVAHTHSRELERTKDLTSRIIAPDSGLKWVKCWECDYEDESTYELGRPGAKTFSIESDIHDNDLYETSNQDDFDMAKRLSDYAY